jgi:hypothetical protein
VTRAYLAFSRALFRRERVAAALGALALAGCRGEDISFDCDNQAMKFNQQAIEEIEPLLTEIPAKGPFPVAVQITGTGLNKLLANIIADDVPFSGTVPFGITAQGPADAKFEPTTPPTILLHPTPGCATCVVFRLEFGVQLATPDTPVSSGIGYVELFVPIRLDVDVAAGVSTLVAEYGNAKISNQGMMGFYLSVFGFDSEQHTQLAGALKLFMQDQIAEKYDDVKLMTIGSWEIGEGKVELLARDVAIQIDNDKIVLGMHTNLPLAAGVGLDTSAALPEGSVMTVSMDPRIMLPMAHRMLDEGNIARTYDENGKPDPQGIYGVTLEDLQADPLGEQEFDSSFRVWRTAEGYCGYAVAEMPLVVANTPPEIGITVTAGKAEVVEGEGIGAAALDEQELVDMNEHLIDRFRKDLADQLADTVNFSAIDLEENTVVFKGQGTELSPNALTSYLDFVVVADE